MHHPPHTLPKRGRLGHKNGLARSGHLVVYPQAHAQLGRPVTWKAVTKAIVPAPGFGGQLAQHARKHAALQLPPVRGVHHHIAYLAGLASVGQVPGKLDAGVAQQAPIGRTRDGVERRGMGVFPGPVLGRHGMLEHGFKQHHQALCTLACVDVAQLKSRGGVVGVHTRQNTST